MGLGGISIWQLLIILLIVLMIFGTRKLKNLGSDLGSAVKGFKNAISDDKSGTNKESEQDDEAQKSQDSPENLAPGQPEKNAGSASNVKKDEQKSP